MSYPTGKRLAERLAAAGLVPIQKLLDDVYNGKTPWPGPINITVKPDQVETIRVLLYGILRQADLKTQYSVKVISQTTVQLDRRQAETINPVFGVAGPSPSGFAAAAPGDVFEENDDLIALAEGNFDRPSGPSKPAGPSKPNQGTEEK